jgi:acyl carrier protein
MYINVSDIGYLPKPEVLCRILSVVSNVRGAPSKIPENAFFATDLQFDNVLRADLMTKLENEFRVSFPAGKANNFSSIPSCVEYFSTHPKAR